MKLIRSTPIQLHVKGKLETWYLATAWYEANMPCMTGPRMVWGVTSYPDCRPGQMCYGMDYAHPVDHMNEIHAGIRPDTGQWYFNAGSDGCPIYATMLELKLAWVRIGIRYPYKVDLERGE